MGRTQAMGMAEAVDEGQVDIRAALHYHLTANHFPPVDPSFVDTAIEAIEKVDEDEPEHQITMPNGITKAAWEIVEGLHLEPFLAPDELMDAINGGGD